MKFQLNSFKSVLLTERTKNAFSYVTSLNNKQARLWFLCMTRHLNVLYKCMKFRCNISNGYQVIERT